VARLAKVGVQVDRPARDEAPRRVEHGRAGGNVKAFADRHHHTLFDHDVGPSARGTLDDAPAAERPTSGQPQPRVLPRPSSALSAPRRRNSTACATATPLVDLSGHDDRRQVGDVDAISTPRTIGPGG